VANTPPASAYEDAPRLTGKIGNINLDRLERPGDVAQLISTGQQARVGGFDAAARGRITHEETRRLAQEMGHEARTAPEAAAGAGAQRSRKCTRRGTSFRLSREAVARLGEAGPLNGSLMTTSWRSSKALLKHVAIEEQIAGATAEAGRLLSQFRMAARAGDAGADAVRGYLKGRGKGKDTLEDAAEAIVDLMEDPAKAKPLHAGSR
jgi:hypothetical protein